MDLNIRIIHNREFVMTAPSGAVDIEKSRQMLLKLASMTMPPNDYDILIDCREVTSQPTITDIIQIVSFMLDHRSSFRNKLAILTHPGTRLEVAKFAELYAQNRGLKVAAFDNFESAIMWLSTATEMGSQGV